MPSPYRHQDRKRADTLSLEPRAEVLASVIATMLITFLAGLSLCVTADEMLGLVAGTSLLIVTLAVVPLSRFATHRRPNSLTVDEAKVTLHYPGGRARVVARDDLLVHETSGGRIALDEAGEALIYVDELPRETYAALRKLLDGLAGYDVMAPAAEARRLAQRGSIKPELRFETRLGRAPMPMMVLWLAGLFMPVILMRGLGGWGAGIFTLGIIGIVLLARLSRTKVRIEGDQLLLISWGWRGERIEVPLKTLTLEPTTWPHGLALRGHDVRLYRALLERQDWEVLVALLSRAHGYDVTEPATEAARLAALRRSVTWPEGRG